MFVASFLLEVDVGLIADEQLVTSVAGADGRSIDLIAVTDIDTVKTAANHRRNGIGRAV